jgi:glycosyltransferase involved in cell wall biosynthesis
MHGNADTCLISFLHHEAFIPAVSNVQDILNAVSDNNTQIFSVSPDIDQSEVKSTKNSHMIEYKISSNLIFRVLGYFLLNMKLSCRIWSTRNAYSSIVFFHGQGLFLPMVVGKLLKKKIYWLLPSSGNKMLQYNPDPLTKLSSLYFQYSLEIADHIVLYSLRLVSQWNLEKFRHKILICPLHNVNVAIFYSTTPIPHRPHAIGYAGRLSAEKGFRNFVHSLPAVLGRDTSLRVYIIGDGPLKGWCEEFIRNERLEDRIELTGWISNHDLPPCLNRLELLVIPSYTEGGPMIMLEAIACGTPVLATRVGSVEDYIFEGRTGFILKNNTPDCIAQTVVRVLNSPDLDKIAETAGKFFAENLTFENSVRQWKKILDTS